MYKILQELIIIRVHKFEKEKNELYGENFDWRKGRGKWWNYTINLKYKNIDFFEEIELKDKRIWILFSKI